MTRFGRIISADIIELDLQDFLKKWIYTYLSEIAEQNGDARGAYPKPIYWTTTPILTNESVSQVRYPACLVVSPGLASRPVQRGDGNFEGTYQIGCTMLTTAGSEANSSKLARRYGAATRAAVMQRQTLETDYIEGLEWIDERFTDFLNAEQEGVSSATEIFNVTAVGIFNARKGPGPQYLEPLPEPATAPNATYADLAAARDPSSAPPYSPLPPTTTRLD
jgi:hypothetical protein